MEKKQAQFQIIDDILYLEGYWCTHNLELLAQMAQKIQAANLSALKSVDGSKIDILDTNGAWIIIHIFKQAGFDSVPPLTHVSVQISELWQRLCQLEGLTEEQLVTYGPFKQMVSFIGRLSYSIFHELFDIIAFTGQLFVTLGRLLRNPSRFRFSEVSAQIFKCGVQATMIVSLIAFSIAVVIGFLMIAPLGVYGMQNMTVSLVSMGILQEMGVLLTAIMVAGRTGSAFAAELGVMNVNEETSALESLGMDPFEVLVVPRIIGIVISLCLLTIIADFAGMVANFLIAFFILDHSWTVFSHVIFSQNLFKDFMMGFSRAPVYGLVIGVIGCMRGLQVENSAQEVGSQTTASVVQSIFLVIFLHAGFALLFQVLGVR